jgi:iron complex outermembrane recepter protein
MNRGAKMNTIRKHSGHFPRKLSSVAVALLLSFAVHAQVRSFDIPAGEIKAALDAYAAQTGQQIVYRIDDLKGLRSKGAQASLTLEQALERLLEGTPLKVRRDASGAAVIYVAEPATSTTPSSPSESAPNTSTVAIEKVVVIGSAYSHLGDTNRTGTRTDIDPMALPQSVSTVSKELLQQQQVRDIRDAVANVAGVSGAGQEDGLLTMRGFPAGIMRNGNIVTTSGAFNAPLITISKIEVVKGPEAIIAGVTSSYGGVVNVITKTPEATATREVVATVGSRGYYDLGVDLGGAITDDKQFLGRLILGKTGEGRDSVGYDGSFRDYVAPSLSWSNRASGTNATLSYEYQNSRTKPLSVVYFDPARPFAADAPQLFTGPTDAGTRDKQDVVSFALTQRVAAGWELGLKFSRDHRTSSTLGGFTSVAPGLGFAYPELFTYGVNLDSDTETKTAKIELKGEFDTGPVSHTLLMAYDDLRSKSVQRSENVYYVTTNILTRVRTDVTSIVSPLLGDIGRLPDVSNFPKESGVLVYDHVTWGNWVGLAGWRQIRYVPGDPQLPDQATFNKGLPSLGLVYRITPTLSLYGSSSKGFVPAFGQLTKERKPLPPETSTQAELGFKALFNDRKLAFTAALYEIKQRNAAQPDFENSPPTQFYFFTVPGVTARGAEFELSGNITPRLSLRSNYAYLTKQADTPDLLGLNYVKHQASVWMAYRFGGMDVPEGQGWWLGGGIQARSGTVAAGAFPSPAEQRFDLNGGYQAKRWSVVAGVKNLADSRLYTIITTRGDRNGFLVQPREFYATFRYNF